MIGHATSENDSFLKSVFLLPTITVHHYGGYLLIAETTKSIDGRLSNIRDVIKKHGFEVYVNV